MSNPNLVEGEPIFFQTKLHSLIDANLALLLPQLLVSQPNPDFVLSPAQLKKEARLELSLRLTSETVGFLHAVLIQIDGKNYLLAGGSGVGKSTYGQALTEHFSGKILANDWVGIEKDGEDFFVSDVNYPDQIKHQERCHLDGIIFLTKQDAYERDAFAPNDQEYAELLAQTFDTATPEELEILKKFWLANQTSLPHILAVPTRQQTQEFTKDTLINLVERQKLSNSRVGVIGLGAIGAELANQLGQLDFVDQVHLYNRTSDKAIGYAMDMNQGVANKGEVFVAHEDPAQVFADSDVVFLCFRDAGAGAANGDMPERWGKAAAHAAIMRDYARIASEQNFAGTIFVLTNPVDLLTFALYSQSQEQPNPLRTYQVYGVGLELDKARALYYAQQSGLNLDPKDVEIFGNHSDTFILKTPLSVAENELLRQQVAGASPAIRQHVPRTVYGPVSAAKQAIAALSADRVSSLTTIQNSSFIGRPIEFRAGLPMFGGKEEDAGMRAVLETNQKVSTK